MRGGAEVLTVLVPFTFRKRGGRKIMAIPVGVNPERPRGDSTLVKALARAFRWKKMLESGEFATVADLAAKEIDRLVLILAVGRGIDRPGDRVSQFQCREIGAELCLRIAAV